MSYTEDTLVQQTTTEYLENALGWDSVFACNNETFGRDSMLGQDSDHDVVLVRPLREKLVELLARLKAEKLRIDHWRDKKTTRDAVRVTIRDHLWSDDTGLPVDACTEEDVNEKAEDVFRHVYQAYPELPSPYYSITVT